MNSAIEIGGAGILAPAAVAAGIAALARRALPGKVAERYAASLAFAAAFGTGYMLLPSWAELIPKRHWQWAGYLALATGVIGPIAVSRGLAAVEGWVLCAASAFVAAWLLVPSWSNLDPPRMVWVPLLTAYLFAIAILLEPLSRRMRPPLLLANLTLAAAGVAALLGMFISVTYARVAAIAAAALAGAWASASLAPRASSAQGLSLVYAVVVGGCAFVGCVEPPQPLLGMLVAPAAPLALWFGMRGSLARLGGVSAVVVSAVVVFLVLALAAGWLFMAAGRGYE